MILSVVGPGENALAPMTVASTRFGPRRPSAVVDGIGTAGALVERTQYATFNERNAIVRVLVVLTQESAHSATTACRRAASAAAREHQHPAVPADYDVARCRRCRAAY